jgi:hypothetical protein
VYALSKLVQDKSTILWKMEREEGSHLPTATVNLRLARRGGPNFKMVWMNSKVHLMLKKRDCSALLRPRFLQMLLLMHSQKDLQQVTSLLHLWVQVPVVTPSPEFHRQPCLHPKAPEFHRQPVLSIPPASWIAWRRLHLTSVVSPSNRV